MSGERQRLEALFEEARKHAREMNQRAVQCSIDVAKEKTQYFEKIALGSGATIALVVSFVGSHAGRLHPAWLLRSALVALVLAMIAAVYRNWKYPFYTLAFDARQDLAAKRDRERCRRNYIEYILSIPEPVFSLDDGKPLTDIPRWQRQFAEDDELYEKRIAECEKQRDCAFKIVKITEYVSLVLAVTGMVLLIALAWKNF